MASDVIDNRDTTGTSKFTDDLTKPLTVGNMTEGIAYRLKGFVDPTVKSLCNYKHKSKHSRCIVPGNQIWLNFSYADKAKSPGGGYDSLSIFSGRKTGGNCIIYFDSIDEAVEFITGLIVEVDKKYAIAEINNLRRKINEMKIKYQL